MRNAFAVTYNIVTPESAESGYIVRDVTFREVWDAWEGSGCYVEADTCPIGRDFAPRWLTAYDVNEGTRAFFEGESESRSLHIPESVTFASRMRIARLAECDGIQTQNGEPTHEDRTY